MPNKAAKRELIEPHTQDKRDQPKSLIRVYSELLTNPSTSPRSRSMVVLLHVKQERDLIYRGYDDIHTKNHPC